MKLALSLAATLAVLLIPPQHAPNLPLTGWAVASPSLPATASSWSVPSPSSAPAPQTSAPSAQGASASKPEKPSGATTHCLEVCWKTFEKKTDFCHARSWVCDASILWICVSKHQNPVFLQDCLDAALAAYNACAKACAPAP
jgi:hypothetical protein